MTRYYSRAVTIVDAEELAGVMMEKLAELFDEKPSRCRQRGRRDGGAPREAHRPRLALLACLLAAPGAAGEPLDLTVAPDRELRHRRRRLPDGPLRIPRRARPQRLRQRGFGGFSGIDMIDDETALPGRAMPAALCALALVHENGRLVGLADAEIDSLFPDGDMSKQAGDAEDIAFDPQDPQPRRHRARAPGRTPCWPSR